MSEAEVRNPAGRLRREEAAEAAPPSVHPSPLAALGAAAVRGLDYGLRRLQGIEEYSRREDCIFRIALARASEEIRLADGTHVRRGEPVGELHYWNEHVPRLDEGRPALAWALAADRAVRRSLEALAEFVEAEPRFRGVQAFGGVMCGLPVRGAPSLATTGRRYGFEAGPADPPRGLAGRLHRAGEDILIRLLAWAYNPSSLRGGAAPARCKVWISRKGLLARYGRPTHA
jgi:YkoP-like protein